MASCVLQKNGGMRAKKNVPQLADLRWAMGVPYPQGLIHKVSYVSEKRTDLSSSCGLSVQGSS